MKNRIIERIEMLNKKSLSEYTKGNIKNALELKKKENYIKDHYSKILTKKKT